jgi:hypothetical protein
MKIFETKPKPGTPVRHKMFYNAFLRMAKAWENLAVHNGHVDWSSGIPTIVVDQASSGGVDFTQFAFGCSVSEATVTVQAGKVRHGTEEPIEVESVDVTITADQTWVWIEYEYGSGVATIESGTTEPQDDVATHKHALSLWGFADDVATLEHTCHVGDIFIPGVRAQ